MMGRMRTHAQETPGKKANWAARIILVVVALLVVVIAYFALAAAQPAWWANVIRNQVQGNLGVGILVRMFYGFVFTFVPLLVAWQATRRAVGWPSPPSSSLLLAWSCGGSTDSPVDRR